MPDNESKTMIYSMTGYACKTLQLPTTSIQLEIKSVNHRFLDLAIKISDDFKPIENLLRLQITNQLSRGKVDLRISFKENGVDHPQLRLNQDLLEQYLGLIEQINQKTKAVSQFSATDIIAFPGMLIQQHYSLEELQTPILSACALLLKELQLSQQTEGEKLAVIMQARLTEIQAVIALIQPLLGTLVQNHQLKLKQRISEALNNVELNDSRLQQEFAFFCQKMDVSEEIDRLKAHVAEFNNLLVAGGPIGKRLDFICQEMQREANTFGAKSISIETTQKAVELKVLIEQIREQVQNLM